MQEIVKRLGLTEDWLYEDAWNPIELAFENALEGGTFQSLKSGEMLTLRTKLKDNYSTSSGKIEFYSAA